MIHPNPQESPEVLPDVWSVTLPAATKLAKGSKYKLYVVPEEKSNMGMRVYRCVTLNTHLVLFWDILRSQLINYFF